MNTILSILSLKYHVKNYLIKYCSPKRQHQYSVFRAVRYIRHSEKLSIISTVTENSKGDNFFFFQKFIFLFLIIFKWSLKLSRS